MLKKIILFFVFNTALICAQEKQKNATVKLIDGTFISGSVEFDDSYRTPEELIIFNNGEKWMYTPDQVDQIEFDNKIYIARILEIDQTDTNLNSIAEKINEISIRKHVFLRKRVGGNASLLTYKDTRVHYFVAKDAEIVELVRIPRFQSNGKSNPYNKYLGQLTILLSDCLDQEKINQVSFSFSSLTKIINEYNICTSGQSNFVESKAPLKVNFGVVLGYKFSDFNINREIEGKRNYYRNGKNGSSTFGVAVDFNIFKSSERLQLYNELLYQSYNYEVMIRDEENPDFYVDYTSTFDVDYLELTNSLRYNFSKKHNGLVPFVGFNLTNIFAVKNDSGEKIYEYFYDSERTSEGSFAGEIKKYGISYSLSFGLKYNWLTIEGRYGYNPKLSNYPMITNATNFSLLLQFKIL